MWKQVAYPNLVLKCSWTHDGLSRHKSGDRYPLRPPSLSRSRKVVIRQAHNLKTAGAIPASATKYSLIAQLVEHLTVNQVVPGSSPGRGAKFGDAAVMVWQETVNLPTYVTIGSIPIISTIFNF